MRAVTWLRAEPLEERTQGIQCGEHGGPAQSLARAWADLLGKPALETDRLLDVKPFEVAIFGVLFEPGERGCSTVDRMLTKAPRLFEVDEVSALDSLIFRVVHPAPAPSHSLRRVRDLPLLLQLQTEGGFETHPGRAANEIKDLAGRQREPTVQPAIYLIDWSTSSIASHQVGPSRPNSGQPRGLRSFA